MTPIGHTLTGLTIGYLAIPRATPIKPKMLLLAAFAIAASVPDLPLPFWGHFRYEISHNIFSTTLGVLLLELVLVWRFRGREPVGWRVMLGLALAWYSHLLLDSMYNHGYGVAMFLPLSEQSFALPVPWLARGDREHIFSLHNVMVAVYEVLTFAPLVVMAYLVKKAVTPEPAAKTEVPYR
jgi:membrane-bound metal-dependent hydrolase YbcI (DUF457 family)